MKKSVLVSNRNKMLTNLFVLRNRITLHCASLGTDSGYVPRSLLGPCWVARRDYLHFVEKIRSWPCCLFISMEQYYRYVSGDNSNKRSGRNKGLYE